MISAIRFIRFLRIGVGISDTDVEYADSASNTVAPTTGWQTEAPKWQNGHYIWSRTHIYYTNGTEKITKPVCLPSGKGIDKILEMYYQSTSATTLNGGTWVPEPPKWQNGYYIWTCSFIYYTDGTMTPTKPVCTTGAQGPQGPQGKPGKDGKDGTSITIEGDASFHYPNCQELQAAISANPTLIVPGDHPVLLDISSDAGSLKASHSAGYDVPSLLTVDIREDGNIYYSIQKSNTGECYLLGTDVYHNNGQRWNNIGNIQGPQGEPGKDGADAVQYYMHVAWCNTPDNSDNSFVTSCDDGDEYAYMGTCTDTTKEDPEVFSAYRWTKVKGEPGESAVSIQISMPAILHKKSNYAATYSITVKAMRNGGLLDIKSSIHFTQSMVVGVIPKKSVSGKIETITVSISANVSANVDMVYEATVAGRVYSYTIPIRTVEDGADGKPGAEGKNGKWMRGPQSWEELGEGYTFYPLSDEDSEMFDVVEYGGKYYECNKKHVKSSDTTPLDDYTTYGGKGNWSLSSQFSFVATKVLWSKIGQIDFFGSQSINVYGESNNSRICLRNGMIEIFGSVNTVVPNIRFGVDPATGCAIMSYYDNKGNWLYDLGPGGWDNKNVTKGRLESFDYLPAHEYLNLINKGYGMTASDSLYETQAFKIDDKSYYYNVAVTKVDICLFPRSYADDSTELSKHPITGYEPGARITSWKKLYQYTAGRKDSLYFADSAHNLTAELAKEADGKWFTSGNICDGSKLINLASGKYVRRGTSVRMMKVLHVSLGGTTKVPAYGFDIAVANNLSHKMDSITISSQICRTIGGITLN